MEIRFEWDGRAGLRVLNEFIDGRIIEVQGLNGIGKSVAAQLLEIITGGHVFQRLSEFESLRNALKAATIHITNLQHECESLSVTITPDKWAFTQDYQIEPDTVGTFSVDGEITTSERAMSLVSTRIIRGNDTIISQMREVLIRNREEIVNKGVCAKENFEMVQKLKQSLLDISQEDNISVFKRAKESLVNDKSREADINEEITRTRRIVYHLRPLLEMKEQIEELERAEFLTLNEKIAKMDQDLSANIDKQTNLAQEIELLQKDVAAKSVVNQDQLQALSDRLAKLEGQEGELKTTLATQIRLLDILYDDLTPEGFERQLKMAEQKNSDKIEGLEEKWKEVSTHLELTGIGHSLIFRLIPAVDRGLGNKIIGEGIINTLGMVELSVSQLENLIQNRLIVLDRRVTDLPEEQYRQEAESLRTERQQILESLSTVKTLKSKANQKAAVMSTLNKMQDSSDPSGAKRLQSYKDSMNELRQQELFLRIELDRMKQTFEKLSAYPELPELVEKYQLEMSKLNIKEDLSSFYEIQQRKLIAVESNLEEVERRIKDNENVVRKIGNDFMDGIEKLIRNKNLAYFILNPNPTSIEEAAYVIEQTHENLSRLVDNCEKTVDMLGRIHNSINVMIAQLQGREEKKTEYEDIISALQNIYSDYFVLLYQKPEFLKYVFKGFQTVVRFEIQQNNVVLRTHDGQEFSRPLSAFSSGERAFAFSLAMIEVTAKRKEANKLLILDEFGALLDYERFEVLKRHLIKKVKVENLADKVIVILPAREDLKERVANMKATLDSQKVKSPIIEKDLKRLEEFKSSLETKGYFEYVWDSEQQLQG